MKTSNVFVEIDGELRTVSLDYEKNSDLLTVYISSELDDMVHDWDDFNNIYGNYYYKSLRGYRSGRKYKFSDLRK